MGLSLFLIAKGMALFGDGSYLVARLAALSKQFEGRTYVGPGDARPAMKAIPLRCSVAIARQTRRGRETDRRTRGWNVGGLAAFASFADCFIAIFGCMRHVNLRWVPLHTQPCIHKTTRTVSLWRRDVRRDHVASILLSRRERAL